MSKASVLSKAVVVDLLLTLLFEGVLCLVLVLLFSTSCPYFAIILMGKRELVALL